MNNQRCQLINDCARLRGDLQAMLNLPTGVTPHKKWQATVDYLRSRLRKIEHQLSEKRSA